VRYIKQISKNKIIVISFIIIALFSINSYEYSLSIDRLLKSRFGKVEIIDIYTIDNIGIVGFKMNDSNKFGISSYKKIGPIFIFNSGGTIGKYETNDSVNWVGLGAQTVTDSIYATLVKVNDKRIKYILLGTSKSTVNQEIQTLEEVSKYKESYMLGKVKDGFCMIVYGNPDICGEFIKAFDSEGKNIELRYNP